MAQVSTYALTAGQSGLFTRQQIGSIFAAMQSLNSGATAPQNPVAGMLWLDSSTNPWTPRIRNDANTAWVLFVPADGAITNAKLAPVATGIIKGRSTAGAGAVEDLTPAQALAILGITATASQINPLGAAFDNAFLGAGVTGNLAIGAADFGNTNFWRNPRNMIGLTATLVGTGMENGAPYGDWRIQGAAAGTQFDGLYIDTNSSAATAVGETFTASAVARIVAGSAAGITAIRLWVNEFTAPSTYIVASASQNTVAPTDTVLSVTRTIANVGCNQARATLTFGVTNGATIDVTYRIKGLQFDRGPSRLAYPFKALSPAEARAAMGVEGNLVAPGTVAHCAMQTPPAGWLARDGAAYSRTVYAALFAAIGTTYGAGNGSTTFNVPDDRTNFDRGWDGGRGIDVGRVFGSEQSDAIRNISGSLTFGAQMAPVQGASGAFSAGTTNQFMPQQSTANTLGFGVVNFNASASVPTAGENRPRNRAYLPIIKF